MEDIKIGEGIDTSPLVVDSPVTLPVRESDIRPIYAVSSTLDLRDIVIFVREKYDNPWQRVVLETEISLSYEDLAKQNIYVKGVNDDNASILTHIGEDTFCPVRVSSESANIIQDIENRLSQYTTLYGIDKFEILVYGDDNDAMDVAWEYFQEQVKFQQRVYFPSEYTNTLKLFSNGLDISVYAKKLLAASRRNSLTTAYLHAVMEELRAKVKSGKTLIQDFEDTRSLYAKWLTLCITQECNLPPVYLSSYIAEYVAFNVAYPVTKLSFYERLMFMRSLPQNVGYIPLNQEIPCVFTIGRKVYPHPEIAFDLASGEILTDGLDEMFNLETCTALDYRSMFKQSAEVFPDGPGASIIPGRGLSVADTDAKTDSELVNIFTKATMAAGKDGIYMTIRNTLLTTLGGRTYMLYFSEPFGLGGILQSTYFGSTTLVLEEANFNRLLDVKLVLADKARQEAANKQEGREQFTKIMCLRTNFRPALDTYVLMCSEITPYISSGLSYYDKRLRCDKCVMPVVTHTDSSLSSAASVFDGTTINDHIDLVNFRHDAIASPAVSAFGGINTQHTPNNMPKIPVTIQTFRGCKLL